MATKAQIRQRVGEDLGIVPIGQALEHQDQARIDASYNEAYARLKELGLAGWAIGGDVPDRIVPYLCLLIEQKLLVSYSVPESRFLRISNEAGPDGQAALMKIASLTVQSYETIDDVADY